MNKKTVVAILAAVVSVIAIIVVVASLIGNIGPGTFAPRPTGTPAATPTPDPCSPENAKLIAVELDKVSREFDDAFVLAQNTPAAQLSQVITEMQRIRRKAQDFPSFSCIMTLKDYQLSFMNSAIDASLALYSSFSGDPNQTMTQDQINAVVAQVNQDMAAAVDYSNKYSIELARLLGVTLTPSPIPPATMTPSASETPAP